MGSGSDSEKTWDGSAKADSSCGPSFDNSDVTIDTRVGKPAEATADFRNATTGFGADRPPANAVPMAAIGNTKTIGHYEILKELGRGGMGVVYQARDQKLGRIVALKVILSGGHAGEAQRQRFQVEAEAAGRLLHPNIAQVYEVNEDQGQPYLAIEYCSGGTLEEKIREKPQAPREAAETVAILAEALHHAHLAGIIHRDIKPANILLSAEGSLKLVDFGLAKRMDSTDGVTQTGAIMGTLGYMAPEQAAGRTREATAATDVYSLGALLYKLLTGHPPFFGANELETIQSIVGRDPVSIRSIQRKVPLDLETICHKCLEKSPARRYGTAAALANDLRSFLNDQPILARPLPPIEKAWRWGKRHPAISFVIVAGVFLLLFVASCLAWSSYRSYRLMADVNEVQVPLQKLSGRIKFLDEVLTSSALLAASTRDPRWEERYRIHDAQLAEALEEAVSLAPEAAVPLSAVDDANKDLVALEKTAFDLTQKGQSSNALELLTSTKYGLLKKRYAEALGAFTDSLDSRQSSMMIQAQAETRAFVFLAALAATVVVLLFVVGSVIGARTLKRA